MGNDDWRGLTDGEYLDRLNSLVLTKKTIAYFVEQLMKGEAVASGVHVSFENFFVDGRHVSFDLVCKERFGIVCVKCGHRSIKEFAPNDKTRKNYLCSRCYGDKKKTRALLNARQGGRCYIPGCEYLQTARGTMHLHRVVPGRLGGAYTPENCVLVCPSHHKQVEGLSWAQLRDVIEKTAEFEKEN